MKLKEMPLAASQTSPDRVASQGLLLLLWGLSSLVIFNGMAFATLHWPLCREHHGAADKRHVWDGYYAWDGWWYERIATQGYEFDPEKMSSIAFYPAYPALTAWLSGTTGMPVRAALLVISHGCGLLSLILWRAYLTQRTGVPAASVGCLLLAYTFFPTTFWHRMAYSESLFLATGLLTLWALESRRHFGLVAFLAGATTAIRSVGVAFFPVLAIEAFVRWRRGEGWRQFLWLPLAGWGLAAFMSFQAVKFDQPFAFVLAQKHWIMRKIPTGQRRLTDELALQPFIDVYDPVCRVCHWATYAPKDQPAWNMWFANPIYFVIAVAAVGFGAWKGWLTRSELVLAAGLLAVPYLAQGYRNCMASQARYASLVIPMYLVFGQLLERLPKWARAIVVGLSGLLMALYAGMFGNWYWYY